MGGSLPCDLVVGFGLPCRMSPAKAKAKAVPASSPSAGELGRVFFLGDIVSLAFVAQTMCAKYWILTGGQVGLNTQRPRR